MRVGTIPLTHLRRRRSNYRAMTEEERATLRASIDKFGFKSFTLVRDTGEAGDDGEPVYEMLDGHHRWEMAQEKGMTALPVILYNGDGGEADLAMLSFNVTGHVIPEVYFEMVKELEERYGAETVGIYAALDPKFIEDLVDQAQASADANTSTASTEEKGPPDRSRGSALQILLPSTDEVRELLLTVRRVTGTATDAEAVLFLMRSCAATPDAFLGTAEAQDSHEG